MGTIRRLEFKSGELKNRAYLLLGGNVGDTKAIFREALRAIELGAGRIVSQSSLYRTKAWGLTEQPDFLNLAVVVEYSALPVDLLRMLLGIEKSLGRVRKEAWGERTLDIDILLLDGLVIEEEGLKVPHPRLTGRRFALVPLAEIAPELLHPLENKTIDMLLRECGDNLEVEKLGAVDLTCNIEI